MRFPILILFCLVCQLVRADDQSLVHQSEYWPMNVVVTAPVADHPELSVGDEGLMLRNAGDQIFVNFPRKGSKVIDPAATDFFTRAEALRDGNASKPAGIMVSYMATRFFDGGHPAQRNITTEDLLQYDEFVFVYADISDEQNLEAIAKLAELRKEQGNAKWTVLIMPYGVDHPTYKDIILAGRLPLPTAFFYLSGPFTSLLEHNAPKPFGIIVTDANGGILMPMSSARDDESLQSLAMWLGEPSNG